MPGTRLGGTDEPVRDGAPAPATSAILDLMPDAVVALDADARIVLCNRSATTVFGISPEQALGVQMSELVPALGVGGIARLMADAIVVGGGRIRIGRVQTDGLRRGGTGFPLEASIAESHAIDGARWTCVVRDLTEQRQADATLSLFQQAVDGSSSGIVITSARLPGQPITYVNRAFTAITGYAPHEVVGRGCGFLQRDDRAQPGIDALRAAIREARDCTVTLRNYRRDGTLFWNELRIAPVRDPDGEVRHYIGVQTDVTERVQAAREIELRNARFDAVLSLSPDGFVLFDADDRLVFVNPALCAMTGATQHDLLGLAREEFEALLRSLARPDSLAATDAPHAPPTARTPHETRRMTLVRPRHCVLDCTERTHAGARGETVLCFRDVTRESEIDRMKSEFLTTAAHELRTPLASVFGYAELLISREVDPPKRQRMLQTIHSQAKLLSTMIDDLLDLAKIEARRERELKVYPVPVGLLVDGAIEALAALEGPRPIEVEVASREIEVAVDPDRSRQAITHVLSNACRFSAPNSPIRMLVRAGTDPDAGHVIVTVVDRGIGMTPEQRARAFERFYRADPSGHSPGTGLGLSITKEIVEMQGGRIALRSAPGLGTEVDLLFPRAEPTMRLPDAP